MSTSVKLRLVKPGYTDGPVEVPVQDADVLRHFGELVALMDRALDGMHNGRQRRMYLMLVRDRAIACKDSMDYGREESS